jgi:hypothetical protein
MNKILGRTEVSPRCLFTNAFPELGDLTQSLHQVCDSMKCINRVYETCCQEMLNEVETIIRRLSPVDVTITKELKKTMENLGILFFSFVMIS